MTTLFKLRACQLVKSRLTNESEGFSLLTGPDWNLLVRHRRKTYHSCEAGKSAQCWWSTSSANMFSLWSRSDQAHSRLLPAVKQGEFPNLMPRIDSKYYAANARSSPDSDPRSTSRGRRGGTLITSTGHDAASIMSSVTLPKINRLNGFRFCRPRIII